MKTAYKTLVGEIEKRGIKKKEIANRIGVSERAFYNKLNGIAPFTWEEVCEINKCFFLDMTKEQIMYKESEVEKSAV